MFRLKRLKMNFVVYVLLLSFVFLLTGCGTKVDSITLSQTDITLMVGEKTTIIATVLPSDIKDLKIDWSSDKNTIAYVNQEGEITAAAVGTAVITATINDISATITVTVTPALEEFNVIFESKGGSEVNIQKVLETKKVTKPTDPTKDGYNFVGWYTNSAVTTAYDFDTLVTGDITLYAKWDVIKYTVTFYTNQGSKITPRTVNHGSRLISPTPPKRTGHDFIGWYVDEELKTAYDFEKDVISNFELYAKWELTTLNVSYAANGGSLVPSVQVKYGEKITAPTPPTKDNYVFAGWYTDFSLKTPFSFDTTITAFTTLYAKWDFDISSYMKVQFELNGGKIPISSSNAFVRAGVAPLQSYEEGISFNGNLNDESLHTSHVFVLTDNINSSWWVGVGLVKNDYGLYIATVIQIVGQVDDGAFDDCDYVITAWSDSGAAYNFVSSIELDQIVAIEGFDESQTDGKVEGGAIHIYESGENYSEINANLFPENATLPIPSKVGYKFLGWYETSDLSGEVVTEVTKATKVYAKWEKTSYTVTFNSRLGSEVAAQTIIGAGTATQPDIPTREGYTFRGWYVTTLFTSTWNFDTIISRNMTLYAFWIENEE